MMFSTILVCTLLKLYDPSCFDALILASATSFEAGDYRSAERFLYEAERLGVQVSRDRSARLWNGRGALALVRGDLTTARLALREAVAASHDISTRAASLHNLAGVEMNLGEFASAESHEREAIELMRTPASPDLGKALISLSSVQGLRGDWRAAERTLREVLASERSPEALSNLAVVLDKLGRRREARALRRTFAPARFERPDLVDVHALRGATDSRILTR